MLRAWWDLSPVLPASGKACVWCPNEVIGRRQVVTTAEEGERRVLGRSFICEMSPLQLESHVGWCVCISAVSAGRSCCECAGLKFLPCILGWTLLAECKELRASQI